jgi:hypothetical protein
MKDNLGAGQPPFPNAEQRKRMAAYFDSL